MATAPCTAARALSVALLAVTVAGGHAAAQSGDREFPRAWDGRPDLNGIWQAIGTAHWDIQDHPAGAGPPEFGTIGAVPPGQGVVVGNEIPYQPWALEQKQRNFENRYTDDPEIRCYLPGVPRATYLPYPFQIIQGTDKIMIVHGFAEANRTIHMDKEDPEPAPIDSWMGRSHGRWDGDTLVVEAAGFNGLAWFDRAGNFASDALRVTEHYTPVTRRSHLTRSCTKRRSTTRTSSRAPGRCACRSTGASRNTRRCSSSSAWSSPKRSCMTT